MADDTTTVPQEGQTEKEKVPSQPQDGETKTEAEVKEPLQTVPDALKGKSSEDITKMYIEAQRLIGAQGNELGNLRQFKDEAAVVIKTITDNPELKEKVEKELLKIQGSADTEEKPKNGETPVSVVRDPEVRQALEGQIMSKFEEDNGLSTLDSDTKNQVYTALGRELKEMLNPGSNKTTAQILDSIDLTKLRPMLDRAYYLAQRDDVVAKATKEGMVKAQQNQAGAIGSIPSSGGVSSEGALNSEEIDVARRLGISEEDYKKSKPREELKV